MIDFEKELKHYKEKALISEVEDNIKEKDLSDMVDIIKKIDSDSTQEDRKKFTGEI